jgi:hypothetical protein
MPAYSFKEMFVHLVLNGKKTQTIRKKRKYSVKAGDILYLYFGLRTKWCRKLKEVKCKKVDVIQIHKSGVVAVNGVPLNCKEKEKLAEADGFPNFSTMLVWWQQTHQLPFEGNIIYW